MNTLRESLDVLRAIEMARRGLTWLPVGFQAAPAWFGRLLGHAANDEHYAS